MSTKHAAQMRRVREMCLTLGTDESVDTRILDMLQSMIDVAEADTQPMKKGRKEHRSALDDS